MGSWKTIAARHRSVPTTQRLKSIVLSLPRLLKWSLTKKRTMPGLMPKCSVQQRLCRSNCFNRCSVYVSLCMTWARMERRFAEEGQKRQQENLLLKTEMCARMDEGLKKEESARQLVQNDLVTMKEEIRHIKLGSGSTVCSDASTAVGKGPSGTFTRPPPGIGNRLNDFFMPRKMEFKGWVTDYKQCCCQGLTDTEVANFITDLQKMLPDQYQKKIDWDQIRKKQRNLANKAYCQYVVQE